MKDEDLDRCPRCKEDMWKGNKLCKTCQYEEDVENTVNEYLDQEPVMICDMCGHDAFLEENGAYECDLGHVFSVRRERKQ